MATPAKKSAPRKDEWFDALEQDLQKTKDAVSHDLVEESGKRGEVSAQVIEDLWRIWKKFHEIGVHFTLEPGYEVWAIFMDTFPNGPWEWRKGFDAASVPALQLIDRTQDQGRSGDALKCVYYEADGHARLKVIFEYCEGEHYYKYSGWKRLWSQHTLYDSSVDRVDMAELRKIFGDVVRAWFESHLRRNRDLVLRHMKKAYERVETFNQ